VNKIHILPENLINQIAAGEVVERPASVVKELVENSLDAGATLISIKLEAGGRRLIEVADNGCGMSADDALLSLERHATSKIKNQEDLAQIATLGFRGEALPSIAAVSRLKLTTALPGALAGCQIEIAGGKINSVREVGAPGGTVIEVRNLFYNLPARLKFLKTQATELSHINQVVTKLALAHPALHFKLSHQGKVLFDFPPQSELRERVAALFGTELAQQLLALDYREGALYLRGLIAPPALQRAGRDYQFTFVNQRAVRNKTITQAASLAYRGLLPHKRHPIWFLFLELDPGLLDVNVHPAKLEVRFRNQNQVYQLVGAALKQSLQAATLAPRQEWEAPVPAENYPLPEEDAYQARIQQAMGKYWESEPTQTAGVGADVSVRPDSGRHGGLPLLYPPEGKAGFWQGLAPIGQLHQTYLLCQNNEELVIIDQHAAHERITYERLVNELKQRKRLESQRLLFPLQLSLSPRQQPLLEEQIPFLEKLGFELAMFGEKTLVIQAAPLFLANEQVTPFLGDILDELVSYGRLPEVDKVQAKLLQRLACHASIRANQALPIKEMQALLEQLGELDSPFTCPHGRPTAIRFSLSELAKRFKRT